MVIADDVGSGHFYEDMYDDMHNDVDIRHIENMREIINWLENNIGEKDKKWCWATPIIRFREYNDAWAFLEWLEVYERK